MGGWLRHSQPKFGMQVPCQSLAILWNLLKAIAKDRSTSLRNEIMPKGGYRRTGLRG